MSIAILTNFKDATSWKIALQDKLPNTQIDIYGQTPSALNAPFLVCWKPNQGQLKEFVQLKVVQSLGAGVDHIFDTNTIADKVQVTRIIDARLTVDMWEYTLTATLNFLKDFPTYAEQQDKQQWQQHTYKTIPETTIGIMGLGKIGGYVAKRFAQTGFQVNGWSNSKKEIEGVQSFAGTSQLAAFLGQVDLLINILPLTKATRGILNQNLLAQLPQGAYLINVGRGGHLVENDLIPLIESGQLSGATLDVFAKEPLPKDHPFWHHPKIVVTPHIASLTNIESAVNQVVENYQRMMNNQPLLNIVSSDKGY